mmetsp:Transcript_23528/g.65415  ORF Transcript_23528/g.65415 Transcript_23528/m.65415 type:complete len:228 (-) Transcript_23528:390-1073(-)
MAVKLTAAKRGVPEDNLFAARELQREALQRPGDLRRVQRSVLVLVTLDGSHEVRVVLVAETAGKLRFDEELLASAIRGLHAPDVRVRKFGVRVDSVVDDSLLLRVAFHDERLLFQRDGGRGAAAVVCPESEVRVEVAVARIAHDCRHGATPDDGRSVAVRRVADEDIPDALLREIVHELRRVLQRHSLASEVPAVHNGGLLRRRCSIGDELRTSATTPTIVGGLQRR